MTNPGTRVPVSHLLRPLFTAACRCAMHRWKVDVCRSFAGVTVRAEIRSD